MVYNEIYHGKSVVITTRQHLSGRWESSAFLLDAGRRILLWTSSDDGHPDESSARAAALSAAAGSIDKTRTAKGKH